MSKAIKDAGIAIPMNKRIWQWLKDQGPHTGAEVATGINITSSASSSMLSQMAVRKMVSTTKKHSERLGRSVTYYAAIGKQFVVLPIPKTLPVVVETPSQEVVVLEPIHTKKTTVEALLSTLSVADAYELYKHLRDMFNPKD